MKKLLHALTAIVVITLSASAQNPEAIRELIRKNPHFALPTVTTYGNVEIGEIASAPKGYKPFYFTIVSRHGSRYETRDTAFVRLINIYDRAEKLGILTEQGKQVYQILLKASAEQQGKGGELSALGQRQLRDIGRRAYKNFKPIFDGGTIEGKSSPKMRCVFSMVAFVDGLKEGNSTIPVEMEARESYMALLRPITANSEVAGDFYRLYRQIRSNGPWIARRAEWAKEQNVSACVSKLVTKPELLIEKCGEASLFSFVNSTHYLLLFADNFECGGGALLRDIFTVDEQYAFYYYQTLAWTQWTGGFGNPFSEALSSHIRPLVDDVVTKIDAAIEGKNPNVANLRFTHDSYLVPLLGVFDYEGCKMQYSDDWERTVTSIPFSNVIPMGANLQIVLYRNKQGEVLVRSLLNERDVRLPIECETAPFYPWEKMRELAYSNLAKLEQSRKVVAQKYGIK